MRSVTAADLVLGFSLGAGAGFKFLRDDSRHSEMDTACNHRNHPHVLYWQLHGVCDALEHLNRDQSGAGVGVGVGLDSGLGLRVIWLCSGEYTLA